VGFLLSRVQKPERRSTYKKNGIKRMKKSKKGENKENTVMYYKHHNKFTLLQQ
jgi:hypothetical protein